MYHLLLFDLSSIAHQSIIERKSKYHPLHFIRWYIEDQSIIEWNKISREFKPMMLSLPKQGGSGWVFSLGLQLGGCLLTLHRKVLCMNSFLSLLNSLIVRQTFYVSITQTNGVHRGINIKWLKTAEKIKKTLRTPYTPREEKINGCNSLGGTAAVAICGIFVLYYSATQMDTRFRSFSSNGCTLSP